MNPYHEVFWTIRFSISVPVSPLRTGTLMTVFHHKRTTVVVGLEYQRDSVLKTVSKLSK